MTGPVAATPAVSWHAVDAGGRDLATGRWPQPPGHPSPVAALAAAPVAPWPVDVVGDDGRRLGLGPALGPGGERVQELLEALVGGADAVVETLAPPTPGGAVPLPLAVVGLADGVAAAGRVDRDWLAVVDRRRAAARRAVVAAGRGEALEAALHVALLAATERLDPADDADVDAHVASGARLWLVAGAVVSALAGADPDPFAPWARLVAGGWWPVGPADGRLVVSAAG